MAYSLSPITIAQIYTLAQIEEKITHYQDMLDRAALRSYSKDTTQGSQKVDSADIDKIAEILQAWLTAKLIKTGNYGPNILNVTFRGSRRFE